jgi:hypothetical protein
MTPRWIKLLHLYLVLEHRARIILRTRTHLPPFDYSIYTMASPARRAVFHAARPTTFWKGRLTLKSILAIP